MRRPGIYAEKYIAFLHFTFINTVLFEMLLKNRIYHKLLYCVGALLIIVNKSTYVYFSSEELNKWLLVLTDQVSLYLYNI